MEGFRNFLSTVDSQTVLVYAICFLIIVVVLLVLYVVYYYEHLSSKKKKKKQFDLEVATKALEKMESTPKEIVLGDYELKQEENAIISYDELLEQTSKIPLIIQNEIDEQENYDEEKAPISIEEFDKTKSINIEEELNLTKEMAFLKDLKSFRANMK